MTINPEEHQAQQEALTGQTTAEALCKCDNCGRHYRSSELDKIADIHQRLTPGGTVPAGECPHCGALAYEVTPDAPAPAVVITISGGLVQTITIDGQEVGAEIWDYDTDGAGPAEIETDDDGDEYVLRYS